MESEAGEGTEGWRGGIGAGDWAGSAEKLMSLGGMDSVRKRAQLRLA